MSAVRGGPAGDLADGEDALAAARISAAAVASRASGSAVDLAAAGADADGAR
jgi:predicted dehydrogenase